MSVLILMPKIVRSSNGRFKSMKDVHYYGRGIYRESYEELVASEEDIDQEQLDYIIEKFRSLVSIPYIELTEYRR